MEDEVSAELLLDLSHLTEEEQEAILQVLLRDSELRCQEEGRVRQLCNTVSDPQQLKSLSGEWFSEVRAKRYKKHGSDIVQASIRRKKKVKDVPLSVLAGGGVFDSEGEMAVSPSLHNGTPPKPGKQQQEEEEEDRSVVDHVTPIPAAGSVIVPAKEVPEIHNGSAGSTGEQGTEVEGRSAAELIKKTDTHTHHSQTHTHTHSYTHTHTHTQNCACRASFRLWKPTFSVDFVLEKDSDSVSSTAPTEPDHTRLRTSGSTSSLHSNHALSGSMMSLFSSGEFGIVEVRGSLQFSLHYDTKKEELLVQVCRCQDLAHARKNRSDPYVKTYLLPDKSTHSKKKTSVKKKTVNPVFDETLKYKIKMLELKGRTLNLSVWHHDPLRRNIFLGEVEVGLADWDWGQTEPCWRPLLPRVQMSQDSITTRGTIMLSLKFIPAGSEGSGMPLTGELHIWLREAQGLIPTKGGTVDSFVKSYVLPDESRSSRQKTRVVKRTVSPTYNHTMVYDGFQTADLNEACAEITLWEKDTMSSQLLGGVRLSPGTRQSYGQPVLWMDSTEEEVNVWTTMIQNPNTWVDAALPLRTNLVPRKE
ncbi:synaptotagmin-like protein 1 [Megalops cyprinoides]|uniref:synaptotagmin-like protein 1 n=1 Tax=Megalops cyprinoides TaxID=118141 RepID=UPI0018652388|nr:synaptotagmin-like protein 1 [Megalops cyprinoides]